MEMVAQDDSSATQPFPYWKWRRDRERKRS
jgi:hypothetical protein